MSLLDDVKSVVKISIDEKALADKLFDGGVMPILQKVTRDIIPTEIDDALLVSKEGELRILFYDLVTKGVNILEEKTGMDLDGKEENV